MFVLTITLLSSLSALADQCAWNNLSKAKAAKSLLSGNDVILWCQLCSDEKRPSNIDTVKAIFKDKPANGNQLKVTLKSSKVEWIDLAYTYVRTSSNTFTNVGHLVGCGATGVSSFIQTGPGKKKTAYYFDKAGERQDVSTSEEEIQVADWNNNFNTNANRMPASTNTNTNTNN